MSVKYAECTIGKVRSDLGITPYGNMTDQKFREKSGQLTGTVSLAEYKGNICGQHLTLDKGTWTNPNAWKKKKDESAAFFYISNIGGEAWIGGSKNDRWICQVSPAKDFDIGTEIRGIGTVSENGNFKLTGKAYGRFDRNYPGAVRLDINIISNETGYLQGAQNLLWNYTQNGTGGDREFTINETVPLNTTKPYVTVIVRAIGIAGFTNGNAFAHEFWDLKLKRVS